MNKIDWPILGKVILQTVLFIGAVVGVIGILFLMAAYLSGIQMVSSFALMFFCWFIYMEYKAAVYRKNRYK